MASRSDQLHSHQFTLQRVVGALAMRDPNPTSSPLRRIGGALFAGVMIAVLALAAAGVYGVLRPGGDGSWRNGDAVIIEKESGARFVLRAGVLHPVPNYSSALLLLGSPERRTATVSRASLSGVPRGVPLGIPGAPDVLPAAGELLGSPWTVCSRAPATGSGRSGVESVLFIGADAGSAGPVVSAGSVGAVSRLGPAAILAQDQDGGLHLVWRGRRFAIHDPGVVLAAMGWRGQAPTPVATPVLNAVPAGADLAAILGEVPVADRGRMSRLDGVRIGEIFQVESQSGNRQFAVGLADGLADITQVQADLLLADNPDVIARPRQLTQADYASAPHAGSLILAGEDAPPATTPELSRPASQGGVCASFADGAAMVEVSLPVSLAPAVGEIRTAAPAALDDEARAAGAVRVDWVSVPPGRAAVVEAVSRSGASTHPGALSHPGAPAGLIAFVSDLGNYHAVPTRDVLDWLGYGGIRPVRVPASVVTLLPSGPALDPVAASQQLPRS